MNTLINFTGGGVNFRAFTLTTTTYSANQNLIYAIEDYDTENAYDNSTGIHTSPISGTYIFTIGYITIADTNAENNLIRERDGTQTIIQQSTNGTLTNTNNSTLVITTIDEVEVVDLIYDFVLSGSCKLSAGALALPNNYTSFSGSRISN